MLALQAFWAATDTTPVDVSQLANYGVLGIMFIFVVGALMRGALVPGWTYRKLEKQLEKMQTECEARLVHERTESAAQLAHAWAEVDRERQDKTALRTRMDDQVIPLLSEVGHLFRDLLTRERGR